MDRPGTGRRRDGDITRIQNGKRVECNAIIRVLSICYYVIFLNKPNCGYAQIKTVFRLILGSSGHDHEIIPPDATENEAGLLLKKVAINRFGLDHRNATLVALAFRDKT